VRRAAALALLLALVQGCAGPGPARQGGSTSAARATPTAAPAPTDTSRLAALEVRLTRLDEELRRAMGRIEELTYEQQRANGRLDQLVADMDRRLRSLEGGPELATPEPFGPSRPAPPPTFAAPESSPQPPAPAGATPPPAVMAQQPPRPAPSPEPDPAAQRGYVLGTLPRAAIMGEPTPPAPAASVEPQQQVALPARSRPSGPQPRYDAALELLQGGDFAAARDEFTAFLADYPNDERAPAAAYWLAETHYVSRDYETAAALFARNYQTYGPDASRAADNLLKMGLALTQLGRREQACQTFAELDRRHPDAGAPIQQAAARGKIAAGCA
jgi:tol-pal system protein YbgF